jgi:hypothetical protein
MDCKQNLHHDHVLDKHIGKNLSDASLQNHIRSCHPSNKFQLHLSDFQILHMYYSNNRAPISWQKTLLFSKWFQGHDPVKLSSIFHPNQAGQEPLIQTAKSSKDCAWIVVYKGSPPHKVQCPMAAYQVENNKIHRNYKTVTSSPTSKTEKKSPFQGNYRELNLILKNKS